MKGKKHKKGRKVLVILAAIVAISGVTLTFAMPDETNSVHIDASAIEESTLIIGSHLIYLESMNDQIYEIAKESAESFNQYNTYYKSEVAGGTWYEISEASTLADITTDGVVVDEREIEELWMTHHTKSDGITYDLLTGSSVSVFNIKNPYNLEGLDELEPIKLQYDMLQQLEDKSETNKRDILYIEEVYNKNRETETTKQLDLNLNALQKYYEILIKGEAESAMSDMVSSVMEKIDAARRVEVLLSLNESELQKMNNVIGREFIYIQGEITGDFVMSEERKRKADEAARVVSEQIETEVAAEKESLETLRTYIEKKVNEKTEEVKAVWLPSIETETDEAKKAELTQLMEAEIAEKEQEVRKIYAEELKEKEEKVSNLEANKSSRIEEAKKAAIEAVMNEEREKVEGFVLNIDLIDAIGEAMNNVQESYIEYSSKMLEEGTTVLSKTEYRLIQELISFAKAENYNSCDTVVKRLIYLDRVNNSVILENVLEREFIQTELIGPAEKAYLDSLGAGEGDAYKMLSSMASVATKASVLKTQMNGTEIIRNELQFILQAYVDRMPTEEATAYLTERINQMDNYRAVIKADAFAEYAESSLDAHMDWTSTMIKTIQNQAGGGEMDSLIQQKDKLQTELMTALDKNQLDNAKKIETEIKAIDKAIEDLEKELNQILNSNTSSDAEKALAAAQLGTGSASKALQNMKESALAEIRAGNLDGIENIIDGIASLAETQPEGALSTLQDIYQELVNQDLMSGGSTALDELMGKVEDVTSEQMTNFLGNLSENDFASLIQNYIEEKVSDSEGQEDSSDNLWRDEANRPSNGSQSANGNASGNQSGNGNTSGNQSGNGTASGNVSGNGTASGNQSGNGTTGGGQGINDNLVSDDLSALEEVMDGLSNKDTAMVLAGLNLYADQTGSANAKAIIKTYAKVALNDGNPYVYNTYAGDLTYEYIPTDRLARITGFRYIFNDSQKAATLQKNNQYYKFYAFSNLMQKGMSEIEMSRAAGYENVIYISKDIAEEQFSLTTQNLEGTSNGVILTAGMHDQANTFLDYLLEAGGGF